MKNMFMIAILMISSSLMAGNHENLEIDTITVDLKGNYIIQFDYERGNDEINSNEFFYGNEKGLYQLSGSASSSGTGLGTEKYSLSLSKNYKTKIKVDYKYDQDSIILSCGEKNTELKSVTVDKKNELQNKIQSGEIALNLLPKTRKALAILKVSGNPSFYYLVDMFQFHYGGERVHSGHAGEMSIDQDIEMFHSCHDHHDLGHIHSSLILKPSEDIRIVSPQRHYKTAPYVLNAQTGDVEAELEFIEPTAENIESLGVDYGPYTQKQSLKSPCQ